MPKPTQPGTSSVIPFRPTSRQLDMPVILSVPKMQSAAIHEAVRENVPDLTGKRTAWCLIGRGRTGKTMFARWLHEKVSQAGAAAIIAALDPANRSLRRFFDDVAEPPSTDTDETRDWLWALLQAALTGGHNAIVDLGGGNTALTSLVGEYPRLADHLSEGGLEPVAAYTVGTDPEDLTVLEINEQLGFRPRATLIILNEIAGKRARFAEVQAHPTYRAAIDRGAVQLWMPPLWNADVINHHAWRFADVGKYADILTTGAVENWLMRMDAEFAPVRSWFPA